MFPGVTTSFERHGFGLSGARPRGERTETGQEPAPAAVETEAVTLSGTPDPETLASAPQAATDQTVQETSRTTKSGLSVRERSDGSLSVQTPNGFQIERGADGSLRGLDPSAKGVEVTTETRDWDQAELLNFRADTGHRYSVNLKDDSLTVTDSDERLTQTVNRHGGHDIVVMHPVEKDGESMLTMLSLAIDPVGRTEEMGSISAEGKTLFFEPGQAGPQQRELVFAVPERQPEASELVAPTHPGFHFAHRTLQGS